jgi:hypothetical protein
VLAVVVGVVEVVGGDVVVVARAAGVVFVVGNAVDGDVVGLPVAPAPRITLGIRDKGKVVVTGARIDAEGVVDVPDVVRLTEVDVWVRIGAFTAWAFVSG